MVQWNPRANQLFAEVLQLPDAQARQAFLDRECADDTRLRAEIEAMLKAHEQADNFLNSPHPAAVPSGDTQAYRPRDESAEKLVGSMIAGKYKLLQVIGQGGMGAVYMADQVEPVKRRVAVKLIKEGMDSQRVLARFEAERQALALMDHPHIAKVLDAGTTASEHPFFVMELVKGIPINEFCDAHKLTVLQRLDLFRQICSAVHHAHQKGIIHRDLKPTNILVESHDGKPVPKVIDFG
jgi:serine/threonine protein kinase